MSTGWSIGDWQVGQLTDAELRKGIARYQSALQQHEANAPVRAAITDCLAEYQQELDGRLAARRSHRTSAGRMMHRN